MVSLRGNWKLATKGSLVSAMMGKCEHRESVGSTQEYLPCTTHCMSTISGGKVDINTVTSCHGPNAKHVRTAWVFALRWKKLFPFTILILLWRQVGGVVLRWHWNSLKNKDPNLSSFLHIQHVSLF